MSEHSSSDKIKVEMGHDENVYELPPDYFKGIRLYGTFHEEDHALDYLKNLGLESVKDKMVDIFVKNILDQDMFVAYNYQLQSDVSLWSLLESSADVAKQLGLREIDDYKAGLIMKFDEEDWLCLRLDYVNPRFSGSEGVGEFNGVSDSKRYEVALTSKPDQIDWMGYNLYD